MIYMNLYRANNNFELRTIAGENMLVPTGNADFEPGTLLMLNETGGWLWDLLKEEKSTEEILSSTQKEFSDEDGIMESSIEEFLAEMVDQGLVIRRNL